MGAGVFHVRVRDGIGCRHPAKATRSSSPPTRPVLGCVGVGRSWCVCACVCCVDVCCWQDPYALQRVLDRVWMTAVQDGW